MKALSKLFHNKSIVTIISFIICLVILVVAYNYRVDKATNLINVPVAATKLDARTEITESSFRTIKVAASLITDNVITRTDQLLNHYVDYNTFIPEGSLFYSSAVVEWSEMPDSAWSNISNDNTIVSLPVNATTTYGNSIFPGDKIDLYYQTYEGDKLVLGKLIEGIEVLAVKDDRGEHIFKRSADQRNASALIFSVPEDYHLLLRKAMYLSSGSLIPVPRNASYDKETNISSEYLKGLIESKTEHIEPDIVD